MDKDQVILGALLHDIGKFAQRTGDRLSAADKAIEIQLLSSIPWPLYPSPCFAQRKIF